MAQYRGGHHGGRTGDGGWHPGVYRVIASNAPSARADTALVTIMPGVARIEITPGAVELQPGADRAFTARAVRTDGVILPVAVTRTSTGGTISTTGVYSAGSTLGSFRVIAWYLGGVFADTAEVTIAAPAATLTGLTLTPGTASVASGGQVPFNAVPTWSDGSSALPALAWSATGGSVTGGPRVTAVTITGQATGLQTGGTRQFSSQATWSNRASRPVEWLWSAKGGTITVNGLSATRSLAGQFMVIASCVGCTAADTTGVSITTALPPSANLSALVLSPAQALLNPGDVLPLHISASWDDGSNQVPDLAWTVGGGTRSGLDYTAGSTTGTFLLIARHAAGTLADTTVITIDVPGTPTPGATLTSLVLNPSSVSMTPGELRTLSVAATWSDGSTTLPPLVWDVTGGTLSGLEYTAGATAGTFQIIVRHQGGAKADTTAVTVAAGDPLVSLTVSPDSTSVPSGFSVSFGVTGKTASGATVTPPVTWSATGGAMTSAGVYTAGQASGTYRAIASCVGCALADTAVVVVGTPSAPPPPTGSVGDLVVFPNAEIEFILGPQLKSGAASNPWPWFDQNMVTKGLEHGSAFPASPAGQDMAAYINRNYYDLGLVLYTAYYRTGNATLLAHARKVADSWWLSDATRGGTASGYDSYAPRGTSLGGLMLRALDGRPEMWPWITDYVRAMFGIWVGARLNNSELHFGVRDGGYMLLYAAWLAKAHPDPAVRAEFRQKALDGATQYYARLQYPDGSWRWRDDGIDGSFMQPFMVGLLLDGMVATHRLTGDPVIMNAITKSVENIYTVGYRKDDPVAQMQSVKWRGMWYLVYGSGCNPPTSGSCGASGVNGGWDTNSIREVRQLNPVLLHAFGYVYAVTLDPKYRMWGDEVFAATFGKGQGPLADAYYGLADFREKEYNASYRSSGRYLAWRLGN